MGDEIRRRRFLQAGGGLAVVTLGGCLRTTTEDGSTTPQNTIRDSDGDGVINSMDYAPEDSKVQEKSDLREGDATVTRTPADTTNTNPVTRVDNRQSDRRKAPSARTMEPSATMDYTDWSFSTLNGVAKPTEEGVMLSVQGCQKASARKSVSASGPVNINFDWKISVEGYWEQLLFEIHDGDQVAYRGATAGEPTVPYDEKIFSVKRDGETSGSFQTSYAPTTELSVRFQIIGSRHCSNGDHVRTTAEIKNLTITEADN